MISSDGITRDISEEEAVPWQPRDLDELARDSAPTLEEKLALATKNGFEQGYKEALAESGKKEAEQIARINELLRYLGQPLSSVDETLKQSMLSLAAEMASHIVDREVGSDLDYYRTQLDQLSDKLPAQIRVTALRLRPEKARELREMRDAAAPDTEGDAVKELLPEIVDDTELAGDVCLACWQESAVDISLRGRLASIVQSYCGDNTSEALSVKLEPGNQVLTDQPASVQPESTLTPDNTGSDVQMPTGVDSTQPGVQAANSEPPDATDTSAIEQSAVSADQQFAGAEETAGEDNTEKDSAEQ